MFWPQAEPKWPRRATLPPPAQPAPKSMNVWALIKDVVGKGDLSRVATPVQFLEPLSELQQRCEDLEFTELLDQAMPHACSKSPIFTHLLSAIRPNPLCPSEIHVLVGMG